MLVSVCDCLPVPAAVLPVTLGSEGALCLQMSLGASERTHSSVVTAEGAEHFMQSKYPVQLVRLCPPACTEVYTEELHFSRSGSLTACPGIVLALSSFVLIRLLLASVLWKSRSCFNSPNCTMGIKQ